MDVRELILRKRSGGRLERDEIGEVVGGYLDGSVGDDQMAALLMAGLLNGFDEGEAVALTEVFVASGATVDLSDLSGPTVDKHSTGGVADTTTFVVGPLVAAAGAQLAKLSGRALGHTGGTLDKLESIPGLRVDLTPEELRSQVERVGIAVAAATEELVPADKHVYTLRDRTATVDSAALIASSVMSKKIAGGAAHIVLDVKTGAGAFLGDEEDARALADLCVRIGEAHGRRTAALVSDMSQPLGVAVGNALEVAHAIEVLRDEAPGRLRDLSVELAAALLTTTGRGTDEARAEIEEHLASGRALERLRDMIAAQGGDSRVADDPWSVLERAPVVREWRARPGVIVAMDCREIGNVAHELAVGEGGSLDHAPGLEVLASIGDELDGDAVAVRIHARNVEQADRAAEALARCIVIGDEPVEPPVLVRHRLGL
ncbi:MAG: thymidine phosphorylase [Nitriliruptorales bacterium]